MSCSEHCYSIKPYKVVWSTTSIGIYLFIWKGWNTALKLCTIIVYNTIIVWINTNQHLHIKKFFFMWRWAPSITSLYKLVVLLKLLFKNGMTFYNDNLKMINSNIFIYKVLINNYNNVFPVNKLTNLIIWYNIFNTLIL